MTTSYSVEGSSSARGRIDRVVMSSEVTIETGTSSLPRNSRTVAAEIVVGSIGVG